MYVAPGETFQLHADPASTQWPRLLTALHPAALWDELGRSGFAYELRAEAGPGTYETHWPIVAMGPEKHLAYAVQWFAMALALLALYLYLGWHNKRRSPMGAAMNPPSTSDTPDRRKGRWQLILILMMVIGPMALATFMYKLQFWVPDSRSYHGELIGNGQTRADIGVQADEQRWQLLVTAPTACAADCQQLVYLARQLQISLGRDASRASHALAGAQPLSREYEAKLKAEYPQLQRYPLDVSTFARNAAAPGDAQLWIVDPTAIWCCATTPGSGQGLAQRPAPAVETVEHRIRAPSWPSLDFASRCLPRYWRCLSYCSAPIPA